MFKRLSIFATSLALLVGLLSVPPALAAPSARVDTQRVALGGASSDLGLPMAGDSGPTVQSARLPLREEVALVAVVVPTGARPDQLWVRGVRDGVADAWADLTIDASGDGIATEPFVLTGADAVEVASVASAPVRGDLVVYSSAVTHGDATASDLAWDAPRILSRRAWQANESIVKLPYERGEVTGAMIHHTAGTNDYTAAQVPAILRSIQAYHVNGRGWKDMGYNVLVDRFGRAWEGRGGGVNQAIAGGHAWKTTNYRTFGISLMGNFELVQPPAVMLESASQVIAWKLQIDGVNPFGETWGSGGQDGGSTWLPAISGHRDENATNCPGQFVYSRMHSIRSRVKTIMDTTRFARFRDVPVGMQFETDMRWLAARGVSTGWPDATYRPLQPITREAMAAFIYRLSGSPDYVMPEKAPFTDLATTGFSREIAWLAATGVTTGWPDGTFRPSQPISREAMAAFVHRLYVKGVPVSPLTTGNAVPTFSDTRTSPFQEDIAWFAAQGITTGWPDGTFRPLAPVNRDAMAAFLHRAITELGEPKLVAPTPLPTPSR